MDNPKNNQSDMNTTKNNENPAASDLSSATGSMPILSELEEYENYVDAVARYESMGTQKLLSEMQEAYQRYRIAYEINNP